MWNFDPYRCELQPKRVHTEILGKFNDKYVPKMTSFPDLLVQRGLQPRISDIASSSCIDPVALEQFVSSTLADQSTSFITKDILSPCLRSVSSELIVGDIPQRRRTLDHPGDDLSHPSKCLNEVSNTAHSNVDTSKGNKILKISGKKKHSVSSKTLIKQVSRFKGICFDRNRWRASVKLNGKMVTIGRFSSEVEAAKSYDQFILLHMGEGALTNFDQNGNENLHIRNKRFRGNR